MWRGLAEYQRHNKKRYFFGCSSITSRDAAEGAATWNWLKDKGHLSEKVEVRPHAHLACEADEAAVAAAEVRGVPPLFRIYLRYGAKVCSLPAMDRELGTIDFVTMLDLETLAPGTVESFGVR